ncbi:MAG: MFS transporter [Firmicutes bacterium]|nr:MFS transporter [Bacillota bacterium]
MKNKTFQGWYQAVYAALLYLLISSPVQYGIMSLLIPRMALANGWEGSVVSISNSLMQGSIAIFASVFNVLAKRFPLKRIMIGSSMLGIASCVGIILMQNSPYVVAALCIPLGASSSMVSLIPTTILVNNWFNRNKSLPMSIVISSGGFGGIIFPLVFQKVLGIAGNAGCVSVVIVTCIISILIVAFLVTEKPSEIGEIPDGIEWSEKHPADPQTAAASENMPDIRTLADLMKKPAFYIITVINIGSRFVMSSVCGYLVLFAAERNIAQAAIYISAFNLSSIAGRLSVSLKDKLNIKSKSFAFTSIISMLLGSISVCVISSTLGLAAGTLLCGFGFGLMTSLCPIISADYFGDRSFSLAYGTIYTATGVAAFLIPMITVFVYSFAGSYICAYVLNLIVCGISFILCALLKKETAR